MTGGQGWIRTIEDIVDGFTVRCIWPLCNLPKTRKIFTLKNLSKKWSWRKESNLQPADYKSAALPLSHASETESLLYTLKLCKAKFYDLDASFRFLRPNEIALHFISLAICRNYLRNNAHEEKEVECKSGALSLNPLLREICLMSPFGALRWNRTTDTRIFSPLLYRLSYQGKKRNPCFTLSNFAKQRFTIWTQVSAFATKRNHTPLRFIGNLSQQSYENYL